MRAHAPTYFLHIVHHLYGPVKIPSPQESHTALLDHLFHLQQLLLINRRRQKAKAGLMQSIVCVLHTHHVAYEQHTVTVCSRFLHFLSTFLCTMYFLSTLLVYLRTCMVPSFCRHRAKPMEDIEVCAHRKLHVLSICTRAHLSSYAHTLIHQLSPTLCLLFVEGLLYLC